MSSFFKSWKSHYVAGYLLGLLQLSLGKAELNEAIARLDEKAYKREWKQNLRAKNPNKIMSDHQLQEARAWGEGMRAATGLNPPFPKAYEDRTEWV